MQILYELESHENSGLTWARNPRNSSGVWTIASTHRQGMPSNWICWRARQDVSAVPLQQKVRGKLVNHGRLERGSRTFHMWWRQLVYKWFQDRNNVADRLAMLTIRQNSTGLEPVIGISNMSVTEDISKWLAEEHQKEWHKATACKQAKTPVWEHLNPKRAADMRRLSRTEVETLAEVSNDSFSSRLKKLLAVNDILFHKCRLSIYRKKDP